MKFVLNWLGWLLGRFIVSMRYRVKVVGKAEALAKPGPYLVLPNHVGFTDPPLVYEHLWPVFHFRPVVNEVNFENPLTGWIAWLIGAVRVPDMEKASADAQQRAATASAAVVAALKAGQNVVVWPSGRLTRDGRERLGGARAVSEILAAVPKATVVLVRTRGLWGSWFSWAYASGKLGHIAVMLVQAAWAYC